VTTNEGKKLFVESQSRLSVKVIGGDVELLCSRLPLEVFGSGGGIGSGHNLALCSNVP
jgi:hypothetical protein